MSAWPAALDRIRDSRLPRVLFVTHAFGGGVERHVRDLARSLDGRAEPLLLQPAGGRHVALRTFDDAPAALHFEREEEWATLLEVLRAIGIDRVHFHHVHGFPPAVLELPAALGAPHDVTLHDYFPLCPNYHLTDGAGNFCGGGRDCFKCLEAGPAQWPLDIAQWRAAFAAFLRSASRCIAPSADCAARMREHIPGLEVAVWPHPREAGPLPETPVRVLVPGGISPAKGLDVLERCARDARERGLPLHFRVLGFVARPLPHWPALPLTVSGEFPEGRLPELLALERGDVAFFPAQCAETYSYTLTDALDTGMPIVATDLGALPERIARRGNARLVRRTASAREMNDALLAAAPPRPAPASRAIETSVEDYAARYCEGLVRHAQAPQPPLPAFRAAWLEAPVQADPPTTTLAWLFDDGVLSGKASSLEKLRRRTLEADARLAADAAELAALRRDAAAARAEVDALHRSTSWRLTAPLRALVTRLRRRG